MKVYKNNNALLINLGQKMHCCVWDNRTIILSPRAHIKGHLAMQVIRIIRKRRNHANIFGNALIKSKKLSHNH